MWSFIRIITALFIIGIFGNLITTVGTLINPDNETATKTANTIFGIFIFGYFLLDPSIRSQILKLQGPAKPIILGGTLYFSNLFLDPKKQQQLITFSALVILYQAFPLKFKELPKVFMK